MEQTDGAFSRTEMLLGTQATDILRRSRVAVFGLGGVGGYVAEALARAGVGALDIVDNDTIDITNVNRQILATRSSLGKYKADVAAQRIKDINPDCAVTAYKLFFTSDTADRLDFSVYDYVVDAIDTVAGKKQIILSSKEAGVPVISSMGTGNKLDPTLLTVADIYTTRVCPLARVMREMCRKNGIERLKVVYSPEQPKKPRGAKGGDLPGGDRIPGSVSFVPPVAGFIIAGEVIKDLTLKR